MANGKGAADCHECIYHRFGRSANDKWGMGLLPICDRFDVALPVLGENERICTEFISGKNESTTSRKKWVHDFWLNKWKVRLEYGILYQYSYCDPKSISPVIDLQYDVNENNHVPS